MPFLHFLKELNPLRHAFETRSYPHARQHATDFWGKVGDAFTAIAGSLPFSEEKEHVGLFDYFTLMIPYGCKKLLWWSANNIESDNFLSRQAAEILIAPLFIINIPLFALRFLTSGLLTLISLPAVGIVHALTKKEGETLQDQAASLVLETNERGETTYSLGDYLADHANDIEPVQLRCIGTYQQLTLEFYNSRRWHPMQRRTYHAEIDLTQTEQQQAWEAVLKLNVGGMTRRLEKRNIDLTPFLPAKQQTDIEKGQVESAMQGLEKEADVEEAIEMDTLSSETTDETKEINTLPKAAIAEREWRAAKWAAEEARRGERKAAKEERRVMSKGM